MAEALSTINANEHKNIGPSTIETIDGAVLSYVESLNIHAKTGEGFKRVPHIWVSAERAYQIKNSGELRDENGTIIPPMIAIERTGMAREKANKGSFWGNVSPKHDTYTITQVLNQDKTANFANVDSLKIKKQVNFITSKKNTKVVYKNIVVPIPKYVTVSYKINVFTNYQEQINEIFEAFMTQTAQNYFVIKNNEHRYECFLQETINQDSISDLGEGERLYTGSIELRVLGYLIGEGVNGDRPMQEYTENQVEFKFNKESTIISSPVPTANPIMANRGMSTSASGGGAATGGGTINSGIVAKFIRLIGNEVDSDYPLTHNLGTRAIFIQVRENFGDFLVIQPSIEIVDKNNVIVHMDETIPKDSYIVTILG
jgi:hypothetical protein